MHHQIELFYKFRFVFAAMFAGICLLLLSVLVTIIGSNSVINPRSSASANALAAVSVSNTSNTVTAGTYNLLNSTRHAALSTGVAFYGVCRSVTDVVSESGSAAAHASTVTVHGVGTGSRFVARRIGSSALFTLHTIGGATSFTGRAVGDGIASTADIIGRGAATAARTPIRLIGSVTHIHAVSSIIRPSSADNDQVPVIKSESAAEMLARITAQSQQQLQQQQQANSLLAAQLAANKKLDGAVVAGDPNHGGYPAKWDTPVSQDSLVDNWGMYNRECVSYTAWKVYQTYGDMPYWGGIGNANEWLADARHAGIATGSLPVIHSVAISMRGYYGHSMWVEAVSGNMIYVSQYNYDLQGHYSEMWVNGSSFTYIYFK